MGRMSPRMKAKKGRFGSGKSVPFSDPEFNKPSKWVGSDGDVNVANGEVFFTFRSTIRYCSPVDACKIIAGHTYEYEMWWDIASAIIIGNWAFGMQIGGAVDADPYNQIASSQIGAVRTAVMAAWNGGTRTVTAAANGTLDNTRILCTGIDSNAVGNIACTYWRITDIT